MLGGLYEGDRVVVLATGERGTYRGFHVEHGCMVRLDDGRTATTAYSDGLRHLTEAERAEELAKRTVAEREAWEERKIGMGWGSPGWDGVDGP
jgi:hypothetical protein